MLLQLKNFVAVIEELCYCDAKAMLLAPKSSAIASQKQCFLFQRVVIGCSF